MNSLETKFWIGVACQEHVSHGVELGICQFCHGKSSPAKRLRKNDFVIYYSSKMAMQSTALCQKFTALGIVEDSEAYQVELDNGFKPFRRKIQYLTAKSIDIRPLIPKLPFIQNKKSWGYVFRYGFLEIDQLSFDIIAKEMLGHHPILESNQPISQELQLSLDL